MGAFTSRSVQMEPGSDVSMDVAVRDLWQVRVKPMLPNGKPPMQWGIRIGGDRRESLGVFQAEHQFWTASDEIDVAVLSQGRDPVHHKVKRSSSPGSGRIQDLSVVFGPVTPVAVRR